MTFKRFPEPHTYCCMDTGFHYQDTSPFNAYNLCFWKPKPYSFFNNVWPNLKCFLCLGFVGDFGATNYEYPEPPNPDLVRRTNFNALPEDCMSVIVEYLQGTVENLNDYSKISRGFRRHVRRR